MREIDSHRIVLKRHNWEFPALVSLIAAVVASLYAVTTDFKPFIAVTIYLFSLSIGIFSIYKQNRAANARIVTFSKDDWKLDGENLVLEIESDFMLFRVETRKDGQTFQEVMGETQTSEDGKITRVCFSSGTPDEHLASRIVVR